MMKKAIHVSQNCDGKWQVKSENAAKAIAVKVIQIDAIQVAREYARRRETELLIHGRNGKIREKISYGHDPFPPIG